jgi:hypothetical protein
VLFRLTRRKRIGAIHHRRADITIVMSGLLW